MILIQEKLLVVVFNCWYSKTLKMFLLEVFIPASIVSGRYMQDYRICNFKYVKILHFFKKNYEVDFDISINLSTYDMDLGLADRIIENKRYNL